MARSNTLSISLLSLSTILLLLAGASEGCRRCSRTRAFMINTCRTTQYPKVCERTLSRYIDSANPSQQQFAQIALRASLARAKYAQIYLTTLARKTTKGSASHGPSNQALDQCLDQINDSVAQLREALNELKRYSQEGGLDDFLWHMSNVETWASAALTDQTGCAEAMERSGHGETVKAVVRGKMTDVAQATSNALALVNRFVTRRRFVRGFHTP